MKWLLLALALLVPSVSQAACASGSISYFPFNGTATDLCSGYSLTPVNSPGYATSICPVNGSSELAPLSANAYFTTSSGFNQAISGLTTYTIEFFIQFLSFPTAGSVIWSAVDSAGTNYIVVNGNGTITASVHGSTITTTLGVAGSCYDVGFVYNGTNGLIYVNNQLMQSVSGNFSTGTISNGFIGDYQGSTSQVFRGYMYGLRFSNVARTSFPTSDTLTTPTPTWTPSYTPTITNTPAPVNVICVAGCSASSGGVIVTAAPTPQWTQIPNATPLPVQTVWCMNCTPPPTQIPIPTATPMGTIGVVCVSGCSGGTFPTATPMGTIGVTCLNCTPPPTPPPYFTAVPYPTQIPLATPGGAVVCSNCTPPPTPYSVIAVTNMPTVQWVDIVAQFTATPTASPSASPTAPGTFTVSPTPTYTPTPSMTPTIVVIYCSNCTPPPTPPPYLTQIPLATPGVTGIVAVSNLTPQFTPVPQFTQVLGFPTPTVTSTYTYTPTTSPTPNYSNTGTFTPTPTFTATIAEVICVNCTPPPTPYTAPTPYSVLTVEQGNSPWIVAVTTFSAPWPTPGITGIVAVSNLTPQFTPVNTWTPGVIAIVTSMPTPAWTQPVQFTPVPQFTQVLGFPTPTLTLTYSGTPTPTPTATQTTTASLTPTPTPSSSYTFSPTPTFATVINAYGTSYIGAVDVSNTAASPANFNLASAVMGVCSTGTVNYWPLDGSPADSCGGSALVMAGSPPYVISPPAPPPNYKWGGGFTVSNYLDQNVPLLNQTIGSISFVFNTPLTTDNAAVDVILDSDRWLELYVFSGSMYIYSYSFGTFILSQTFSTNTTYYVIMNWNSSGINAYTGTSPDSLAMTGSTTNVLPEMAGIPTIYVGLNGGTGLAFGGEIGQVYVSTLNYSKWPLPNMNVTLNNTANNPVPVYVVQTATPTFTATPSITPSDTMTTTITRTISPTFTVSPTPTFTATPTASNTEQTVLQGNAPWSVVVILTATPSLTTSPTFTATPSITATPTISPTTTVSATFTTTPTPFTNATLSQLVAGGGNGISTYQETLGAGLNTAVIKTSGGTIYGITLTNVSSTSQANAFFYNMSTAPIPGNTTVYIGPVPAAEYVTGTASHTDSTVHWDFGAYGVPFSSGIAVVVAASSNLIGTMTPTTANQGNLSVTYH